LTELLANQSARYIGHKPKPYNKYNYDDDDDDDDDDDVGCVLLDTDKH